MVTLQERKEAIDLIFKAYNVWAQIQSQATVVKNLIDGISVDAVTAAIDGTSTTTADLTALKNKFNTVAGM